MELLWGWKEQMHLACWAEGFTTKPTQINSYITRIIIVVIIIKWMISEGCYSTFIKHRFLCKARQKYNYRKIGCFLKVFQSKIWYFYFKILNREKIWVSMKFSEIIKRPISYLLFYLISYSQQWLLLKWLFLYSLGENEESGRDCEGPSNVFRCSPRIHRLAPFSKGRTSPVVRHVWRFISRPEKTH